MQNIINFNATFNERSGERKLKVELPKLMIREAESSGRSAIKLRKGETK